MPPRLRAGLVRRSATRFPKRRNQGGQARFRVSRAGSGTQDVCIRIVSILYPYWDRLLHRCTARPMTVRISLLRSHGQGPGVRCISALWRHAFPR
eukprot:606289-Pyramimonas_sp.AAC.1